ncbi:hypothetical protein AGLY_009968 [Aphis glycines]|uniref:Uncharacterized protein n=1 Tax=Aphis glycines TaxID=307491 RepID=A0A6G0THC8_APHGL|nr:hypothetical protein AGLY_009968 [Aphis glycines]
MRAKVLKKFFVSSVPTLISATILQLDKGMCGVCDGIYKQNNKNSLHNIRRSENKIIAYLHYALNQTLPNAIQTMVRIWHITGGTPRKTTWWYLVQLYIIIIPDPESQKYVNKKGAHISVNRLKNIRINLGTQIEQVNIKYQIIRIFNEGYFVVDFLLDTTKKSLNWSNKLALISSLSKRSSSNCFSRQNELVTFAKLLLVVLKIIVQFLPNNQITSNPSSKTTNVTSIKLLTSTCDCSFKRRRMKDLEFVHFTRVNMANLFLEHTFTKTPRLNDIRSLSSVDIHFINRLISSNEWLSCHCIKCVLKILFIKRYMIYYFKYHIFHGNMSILNNSAIEIFIYKLMLYKKFILINNFHLSSLNTNNSSCVMCIRNSFSTNISQMLGSSSRSFQQLRNNIFYNPMVRFQKYSSPKHWAFFHSCDIAKISYKIVKQITHLRFLQQHCNNFKCITKQHRHRSLYILSQIQKPSTANNPFNKKLSQYENCSLSFRMLSVTLSNTNIASSVKFKLACFGNTPVARAISLCMVLDKYCLNKLVYYPTKQTDHQLVSVKFLKRFPSNDLTSDTKRLLSELKFTIIQYRSNLNHHTKNILASSI